MARRKPIRSLYAPSVWPAWIVVGFGWLVARLPVSWIWALGRGIGALTYGINGHRRHVTEVNVALCFPELTPGERQRFVRESLAQVGMGMLELLVPWLNPKRDLGSRFDVEGAEHLATALAQGRGVILVGAHFAAMDIIAQPLSSLGPIDVMYRFNKHPVWEWLQVRGRRSFFDGVIERKDTRQVLRRLKDGRAIWYAADQDYGAKHSVFAPFFGVPAATIVATSRFARLNGSPVLFLRQTRHVTEQRWSLHFSPPIEDFPSGDDVEDASRMNALIEAQVRLYPEQYLWLHRRFKTRPEGAEPVY